MSYKIEKLDMYYFKENDSDFRLGEKINEIIEALNAEKAHCTDDPLECPALKRFADAEKTGKFTCACCGVELLPQGEWSLCFNCEKMNADRLHPEAEKAERCPDQKEISRLRREIEKSIVMFMTNIRATSKVGQEVSVTPLANEILKLVDIGKLSTSGEDDLVLLIVKEMYGIPYSKLAIGEAEKCKKLAHAIMTQMNLPNGR